LANLARRLILVYDVKIEIQEFKGWSYKDN